ncbi:hypothetical protein COU80_03760 [Candidatus Peregrinibacteria bacterium CG10_big_fil_rev_8_21_14_0_10_55_24]|nr:MAG: hypothetical protein COU80_03760 [Candidatus Peregrinibacteria bacterium CG10_big_fil_rev_8_21_14_0_10_55_24]
MADYASLIAKQDTPLTEEEQHKAGQAISGDMDEEHKAFARTLKELVDRGEIHPLKPHTFLKMDVYEKLPERWQEQTDLALVNISSLLKDIVEFWVSKETPDSSPQLQTMIEHLWQMKQRIEEHYDVFKF